MIKNRGALVTLCLAALIFSLSSCTPKEASVSQLKTDLAQSEQFAYLVSSLGAEIDELSVVKRQSNREDKTDLVWVKAEIAGDQVEGTVYYKMTYILYNDGWMLETVADDEPDQWSFIPLQGAGDDLIHTYLPSGAEIRSAEIDLDGGMHKVLYAFQEPHLYCDVTRTRQLILTFCNTYYSYGAASQGQWGFCDDVEIGTSEDWHLDNTVWEGNDGSRKYTLRIDHFAPEDIAYQGTEQGDFIVKGTVNSYMRYGFEDVYREDMDGELRGTFRVSADGVVRYYVEGACVLNTVKSDESRLPNIMALTSYIEFRIEYDTIKQVGLSYNTEMTLISS